MNKMLNKIFSVFHFGDITQKNIVNKGLGKEQLEEIKKYKEDLLQQKDALIQQQSELLKMPSHQAKERLIDTQKKLEVIQDRLDNIEESYQEEKKIRKAAEAALQKIKGQLPAAQIEKAQASLKEGNKAVAEKVFDTVVEKGSANIALAAFQSGQLAKDRIDYAKAIKQYKKAVILAEDNPEYLFEAGKVAMTVADYPQAQQWLEHLFSNSRLNKK